MKIYRTSTYNFKDCELIEILRETDKCYFKSSRDGKKEEKIYKSGEYCKYFKTINEVKMYHIKRLNDMIITREKILKAAKDELENLIKYNYENQ